MRSPGELTQAFRERGLKVTPQRQAIFRILHGNTRHPTAEAVYAAACVEMPTISLRTVYQTLNDLATMGELHPIELGTGAVRFDPNLDEHHHLVCDRCGRVQDIVLDLAADLPPHAFAGFEIREAELVLRGRCHPACSAPTEPARAVQSLELDRQPLPEPSRRPIVDHPSPSNTKEQQADG